MPSVGSLIDFPIEGSRRFRLHQIELVATRPSQDTSIQHANLATCTSVSNSAKPRDLVASRENSILRAKETDIWRYQTLFGEFRLRKKVMFLETSGYGPEKALSEESCLSFVSYLLHTAFELRSCEGFSKVPRSLSVFPVIQDSWIFYKWCFPENTEAFKQALSRRELSPYSRDEFGQTFLHRAIRSNNPELCSLLIQIGVDINHRDNDGRKALLGILAGRECKANIVRTLIKANCDIELEDLYYVFSDQYWGSPEAAELLFSACDVSSDTDLVDNWSFSFLTVALREFGVGISRWETWIRRLLHCKEDIHISRSSLQDGIPLGIQPWTHTALDDLFKNTDCPFDAERVAQDWLLMLAEAGFNVNEYLEKERYLHSAQDCLTSPHFFGNERQLVFEMDGKPSIGWEWWFHPLAPGSSVCHEFRNMNLAHHTNSFYIYNNDLWKDTWPYNYPEWSDCYKPGSPIFPLNAETQKLQEWQERKVKPWEKMRDNVACRHGRQTRKKYPQYFRELNKKPPVPGAWIEDSRK